MLAAIKTAQDLMVQGRSQNAACKLAAREFDVSVTTLKRWAGTLRQPLSDWSDPKKHPAPATRARIDYGKRRRGQLLSLAMDKAADILPDIVDASEWKDAAMAIAILIDKARLEEGQATERQERIDRQAALEAARARVDKFRAMP